MKSVFTARQNDVVEAFSPQVDAILVTTLANVRYLTGFTGSSGTLLVEKRQALFFTDFRYQEQSELEVGGNARIEIFKSSAMEAVLAYLKTTHIKKLGVEGALWLDQYETLRKGFSGNLMAVGPVVEKRRQIKGEEEFESLRQSFRIADRAFAKILRFIKPGRREFEIAARLEFLMRMEGSEGPSFDTIVASGERSSCPHAHPTERRVRAGEMLKIDFGAVFQGYHSDMTRTVFLGKATPRFREVYKIVLDAQAKAVKAIKAGAACLEIDRIARDHIAKKGYGEKFGHGLGHALGLNVHETPAYSPKSTDSLKAGMVLTVEPGIYLPGWGGIRIEDVYIVTEKDPIRLTGTSNALLELGAL